ncbi:MAG: bifunctional ADP-dependent NAD(P)H-hydrate dehydratase/NAD(P)H-hydrate epimerase [Sulfobacillus acidophilus]|uniref:Bifunctional NAD(P)H-hydrate repair enzyme n=1 Tax=Sulfobacillus acidophilus TaxID=53633 RepID=A0A2T2WMT2_9FIRM|nr:MAG: bifunctional ADP-dependent NAD(P)H-hydrate dehydratase/NAD(P)H-hydrate epimerase [Sulfobacillus acidophilus]
MGPLQPIWTLEEARAADQKVQDEGVPGTALLAVAGFQLARYADAIAPSGPLVILTGPGSNGGDGWVAARHLARTRKVTVIPVMEPHFAQASEWVRAARAAAVAVEQGDAAKTRLTEASLVVDAMFGTGFHGSVQSSPAGPWINFLADAGVPVLAADMPSGINTDTGAYDGPRLNVQATLTMGAAKWGLVGYPGADLIGTLCVAEIGLGHEASSGAWIDPAWAYDHFPQSGRLDHKYRRGHVVVVGGSRAMPGAPILAATAALRGGAGLVELVVPKAVADSAVPRSPALIVHPVDQTERGDLVWSDALRARVERADAVVFGPGLGQSVDPAVIGELIRLHKPTVVDADGIRLTKVWDRPLPSNWVLTPHAGELGLLLNMKPDEVNADRRTAVTSAAKQWGCPVLLKGRFSLIADGSRPVWVNPTGNQSLATAGSGDVLSGLVARLLAGGLSGQEALALGAYWHGWAGDLGGNAQGVSFTAEDLCGWLGSAAQAILERRVPQTVTYWR